MRIASEITHIGPTSVTISTQGGSLALVKVRLDGADKSSAALLFTSLGLTPGMRLNTSSVSAAPANSATA